MKVAMLEKNLEEAFWNCVNSDPLNYYSFILDVKLYPDQTRIWLALEDRKIKGLLLVYQDYVVQLRGSREAVQLLLNQVTLKKFDLQSQLGYDDIILDKYKPKTKEEIVLMRLSRGNEKIQISTKPERLNIDDAEEISQILRNEDPAWWGDWTTERVKLAFSGASWLGIRQDQKIASVGMSRIIDFARNISIVVTRNEHRNRGYATSIVSALVQDIFATSSTAIIHVLKTNVPAIQAYSKVGFKPYKSYLSIHV